MLRTESLRASETHTPKDSLCQNKKSSGMFKNNPEQISQKDTEKKHFSCVHPSSFIQTILSALELHQISDGSAIGRGLLPPVRNYTSPRRSFFVIHYSTMPFVLSNKIHSLFLITCFSITEKTHLSMSIPIKIITIITSIT